MRYSSMADMPESMRKLAAGKVFKQAQSKYHAKKTKVGKITFASKHEAERYAELMAMLKAGIISDLRLQQDFTVQEAYTTPTGERIRAIRYKADFCYVRDGKRHIEDAKGCRTDTYKLKKKLMAAKGWIIEEV